jgi:membrane protease YdiL (CAAX protease family)
VLPAEDLFSAERLTLVLAGFTVFVVGIALAPLIVALVRQMVPGRRIVFARWGFSHVAQAVLVGIAGLWATTLIYRPQPGEADILAELLRGAFVQGLVCCFVLYVARRLDPDGERCLGLADGQPGLLRGTFAGIVAYAMCVPALIGLQLVWPWLLELLGQDVGPQAVLEAFPGFGSKDLPYAALLAVVVVPLFEETLFRGFLQPLLVQNLNDWGGVVLTSLLFALLHGTAAFLPIFCLSLLLGGLMLRTHKLGVVWAVHGLHNALTLTLVLVAEKASEVPI